MNYPAVYNFYFPSLPDFPNKIYIITPGVASLGYWIRSLRPIKIERVR